MGPDKYLFFYKNKYYRQRGLRKALAPKSAGLLFNCGIKLENLKISVAGALIV